MKIRVVKIEVGSQPTITEIEQSLEASQQVVGGHLACIRIGTNIDMWINEEGLINGLERNIVLASKGQPYDVIHGNVFFTSHDSTGDTIALTDEQIDELKNRMLEAVSPTGETLLAINVD